MLRERNFLKDYSGIFILFIMTLLGSCTVSYIDTIDKAYIDLLKSENKDYRKASIIKQRKKLLNQSIDFNHLDTLSLLEFYSFEGDLYVLYIYHDGKYKKYTNKKDLKNIDDFIFSDDLSSFHKKILNLIAKDEVKEFEQLLNESLGMYSMYTITRLSQQNVFVKRIRYHHK